MVSQIAVATDYRDMICWVTTDHRNGQRVQKGDTLVLAESGNVSWNVQQVFGEYADNVELPPKSRVGTILSHIRESKVLA